MFQKKSKKRLMKDNERARTKAVLESLGVDENSDPAATSPQVFEIMITQIKDCFEL